MTALRDVHEVPLSSGLVALVDPADAGLVGSYRWHSAPSATVTYARGYPKGCWREREIYMHRLVLDAPDGVPVDHINHNGLDNRRANLRLCTPSENIGNARMYASNTSGYRGVSLDQRDRKWCAQIRIDGVRHRLGWFDDPWQAAQVYNAAAARRWGQHAFQNVKIGGDDGAAAAPPSRGPRRRVGHAVIADGPGRWQCKCGTYLGRTRLQAEGVMRSHRTDLWVAEQSLTGGES